MWHPAAVAAVHTDISMETKTRSFSKAISYRIFSSLIVTPGIVYLFTRQGTLALGIGVTELFVKVFTFFLHERIWTLIPYGNESHPLAEFPVNKALTTQDKQVIEKKLSEMGYLGENI